MKAPPSIGASFGDAAVSFRLWAPSAKSVQVEIIGSGQHPGIPLTTVGGGYWETVIPNLPVGTLYQYYVDEKGPFPDPASKFQPQGVHGPSQVNNEKSFVWTDQAWKGRPFHELTFYEIHVGTFTTQGTFDGVREKLSYLAGLGITALELMPIGDFPGQRNWGYDGVSIFAPARCYGTPGDLKTLVDEAHRFGLAIFLDVVYNHFGPDGNYLSQFSPFYFTKKHKTPWGDAINYDGDNSRPVRDFFIANALHWIGEFHFDGLRLDATHAIVDESPRHIVEEIVDCVKTLTDGRLVHVVAEDHRNLAAMVKPTDAGGWGLDGIWADDLHHSIRRLLAGDSEGYYQDYKGTTGEIVDGLRQGWLFKGQHSEYLNEPRGSDPGGIPAERFIVCLQNHDQIGNRAMGDRLNHQIDPAAYRAATVLLLMVPETPLLFMGQEWGASSSFQYFTDHNEALGQLVTQGRREEFKKFSSFSDPALRQSIPDPQSVSTFQASKLKWEEKGRNPHDSIYRLYEKLLSLRKLRAGDFWGNEVAVQAAALSQNSVAILRLKGALPVSLAVICLRKADVINIKKDTALFLNGSFDFSRWQAVFSTEDRVFSRDSMPPKIKIAASEIELILHRPGAVLFEA